MLKFCGERFTLVSPSPPNYEGAHSLVPRVRLYFRGPSVCSDRQLPDPAHHWDLTEEQKGKR